MNQVTVANFRCFREKQTARLAPLTLLVGENSTGKTSFLALTRVLWDVGLLGRFPNFKEPPYDLGIFDEIAHFRGGRGGRATEFEAGFSIDSGDQTKKRNTKRDEASRFDVIFRRDGATPLPTVRRIENEHTGVWAEVGISTDGEISLRFATRNGQWKVTISDRSDTVWGFSPLPGDVKQGQLPPIQHLVRTLLWDSDENPLQFQRLGNTSDPPTLEDRHRIALLEMPFKLRFSRPFAGAPMRSRPHRTYDPSHVIQDAEGDYIPTFLSNVARRNKTAWKSLKLSLERFGQEAGLFDEIAIKTLGNKTGGPFQIHVRKFGKHSKGPSRNIIDVGYGVSQVLPVIVELLRSYDPGTRLQAPRMLLLQQPEVHLHPTAQAALGGLFLEMAASGRQLIVETHSDHLIDRVRMDMRDGKSKLEPADISILYFERRNLAVTIHSLGWDADGNLVGRPGPIPDGYRQFFRTERRRSLGL